jgi:adenine-specific DNA-methyltransferase
MDKMRMESPNMVARNIDKIAELFPNCITETSARGGRALG